MTRLFITAREQQLINDLTKEIVKDVIGQFIHYYPVSILKTRVHPIYEEAVEKIFDNPIKLDVLAGQRTGDIKVNQWSIDGTTSIEIFVQARDLIDKNITISTGDFFLYGEEFFEIASVVELNNIYGQPEYSLGYKMHGILARSGRMDLQSFEKILQDQRDFNASSVQKTFQQQRGLPETDADGATGDRRQIRERLKDDMADAALGEGARIVNAEDEEDISDTTGEPSATSFYDE